MLLLFSCSSNYKSKNDLNLYELKGKVNHVSLYHYNAYEKEGEIIRGEKNTEGEEDQTLTFNKNGYITQIYYYGQNDSLDTKLVREFNNKNNCIKEIKYNSDDLVIGEWHMTYDDRDRQIIKSRLINDEKLFNYAFLHYDEKDRLISRKDFLYLDSDIYDSLVWTYDKKHRQVTEERYGLYGKKSLTKLIYKGKSELADSLYIYDRFDDLSSIIWANYNKKGAMIEASQFGPDSVLVANIKIEYEYDKNGSWIKKTQYFNQEVKTIIERKILYY